MSLPAPGGATASRFVVAAPARPVPRRRLKQISAVLAGIDEIREAHLPEILALGEASAPRMVLFAVVESEAVIAQVRERLQAGLGASGRGRLAVWVVPAGHALTDTVRAAGCVVGWRD